MAEGLEETERLENPTMNKVRRIMSLVYKHGQRYGLIRRDESANPPNWGSAEDDEQLRPRDHESAAGFRNLAEHPGAEAHTRSYRCGNGFARIGDSWTDVGTTSTLNVR